jgi:hypothetical protein
MRIFTSTFYWFAVRFSAAPFVDLIETFAVRLLGPQFQNLNPYREHDLEPLNP